MQPNERAARPGDPTIAVVVHGGAWAIPDDEVEAHRAGVMAAAVAAWDVLGSGGSALDAVEVAVRVLEDDPTFDAGRGGFLNRDGVVELDAGLMEGHTLNLGAVAGVRRVPHPITLARRVLEDPAISMLVGDGALAYARGCGLPLVDDADLVVPREQARWEALRADPSFDPASAFASPGDTVGAVALDRAGHLASGTSTAGSPFKPPGRVGDSPIVGAGFFADGWAGASCTGHGEAILKIGMARLAAELLTPPTGYEPRTAAARAIVRLAKLPAHGGIILLDRYGRTGVAFNTPRMAHASITPDGELSVGI